MSTLAVLSDTSVPSGIILDIVETIAAMPAVRGVIDDVPFDYRTPPRPRPTHGVAQQPYAYVFEGEEQPNSDEFFVRAVCDLTVTVELTYQYSTTDGAQGMKPRGRALLAALQAALLADENRGTQTLTSGDSVKRATRTRELFNAIEETAVEHLGVVVLRLGVQYLRDTRDPSNR